MPSTAAETAPPKPSTDRQHRVGVLMVALLGASIAFQLNATMLSPALVTMQKELNTSAASVALTQTAFFTSAALFSLFLPRLGDRIGRRRVLSGMLALVAIGSVIAALAPNIGVLFIGRVIAGVSGPTVPLCLIMLRTAVIEPKRYGTLMGIIASVNGGVAGVDALAGGFLVNSYGYASVFWTIAAIGAIAAILVRAATNESRSEDTRHMDWLGVSALVISIGSMLTAFNLAGNVSTANWSVVSILAVVSVVAFVAFYQLERRVSAPLVEVVHLKSRSTWALVSTTALTLTGIFAIMNGIVPALAQDPNIGPGLGVDTVSWWTLTPYALIGLLVGPFAGRLAAVFGYRAVLRTGLCVSILIVIIGAVLLDRPTPTLLLTISLVAGIGYAGIANIILSGMGVLLSPRQNPGFLPGLNAGAFNLGAGLSFVLIYGIVAQTGATIHGYRVAMVFGAVVLAIAVVTSLWIPRPIHAETGSIRTLQGQH